MKLIAFLALFLAFALPVFATPGSAGVNPPTKALKPGAGVEIEGLDQNGSPLYLRADPGNGGLVPAGGPGAETSVTPATQTGAVIATCTVTQPGAFYAQNQSTSEEWLLLDDGLSDGNPVSTQALDPASAQNGQGGSSDPIFWFLGRVRLTGATSTQLGTLRCK